jgi:hypothetical protein
VDIDLGTCKLTLPDSSPMVPVQLLCRGVRDSVEALKLGPTTKASQPQAFSRLLQLAIEEIKEGQTDKEGLDAGCVAAVAAYRGADAQAREYPVAQGVARMFSFKWRGPNTVPLRTLGFIHVFGIVSRSVLLTHLDAPKVNPLVDGQFESIVSSLSPEPKIVP